MLYSYKNSAFSPSQHCHSGTNMARPQLQKPTQHLEASVALLGGLKLIFFGFAFLGTISRIELPSVIEALVRWGPGGAEQYEEMISIIYLVWGFFLVKASTNPREHAMFLDFTLYADAAHFSLMAIMAIVNPDDRLHIVGDVLAGWVALAPFAYFWLKEA